MAEFKGTKGPWKYVDTHQHPTESREWHALVQMPKIAISITNVKNISIEETKANAKLIAAAPDLLEALIASKAIFKAQGIDENHSIVGNQYKKTIEAIKKATE